MAGVTFELDDAAARGALARLGAAARNPRPAMDAIGAHFVFSSQRNIEQERAPSGATWPRLSPRTANKRVGRQGRRRGYDHMLRVRNRLYASISYIASDAAVEWGSNLVYARVQQLGGTIDMAPRQGTVRLRTLRKGGGVRFARRGIRNATERTVSIRAHQVRIPARPYLGISPADQARAGEIVSDHLEHEAAGARRPGGAR